MTEAKRSMSGLPSSAETISKAFCERDHSVSSLVVLDSESAMMFSEEAIYEAKTKLLRSSHQFQICFATEVRWGYRIEPKRFIYAIAVVLSILRRM